ncbi:MAG TPA: pilus assembly protein [Chloroflexi bacterium]|nr:pilus assembly protein [Chloroflexota bacterium]
MIFQHLTAPSSQHRTRSRPRPTQGQALLEFALFVVVLFLVAGGLLDVGRALMYHAILSDAAQEGVAYGTVYPQDEAGIRQRTLESAGSLLTRTNDVEVAVIYQGAACAGNGIKVQVKMTLPLIFPFSTLFAPSGEIHITGEAVQTILRPPCR